MLLSASKAVLRKLAKMNKKTNNLPQLIMEWRKLTHCLSASLDSSLLLEQQIQRMQRYWAHHDARTQLDQSAKEV